MAQFKECLMWPQAMTSAVRQTEIHTRGPAVQLAIPAERQQAAGGPLAGGGDCRIPVKQPPSPLYNSQSEMAQTFPNNFRKATRLPPVLKNKRKLWHLKLSVMDKQSLSKHQISTASAIQYSEHHSCLAWAILF